MWWCESRTSSTLLYNYCPASPSSSLLCLTPLTPQCRASAAFPCRLTVQTPSPSWPPSSASRRRYPSTPATPRSCGSSGLSRRTLLSSSAGMLASCATSWSAFSPRWEPTPSSSSSTRPRSWRLQLQPGAWRGCRRCSSAGSLSVVSRGWLGSTSAGGWCPGSGRSATVAAAKVVNFLLEEVVLVILELCRVCLLYFPFIFQFFFFFLFCWWYNIGEIWEIK